MLPIASLSDLPKPITDLMDAANEIGGALLVFDHDDQILFANDAQRQMMPVCSYNSYETYSSFFWGAFNLGLTGNASVKNDPQGWLKTAIAARKSNPVLHFGNSYPWGKASCSNFCIDSGVSIQIRINLTESCISDFTDMQGMGLGAMWAIRAQNEIRALKGALDSLGLAVGVINRNGKLLYRNASLIDLLESEDGLLVSEDGFLVILDPCDDMVVSQAIEHITGGLINRAYAPIRREAGSPLIMSISSGTTPGTAVLTISRFGEDMPEIAGALKEVFGISPAEADVMAALGSGASVPDLAAKRGTSEGTIYNQVSKVKTALRRSEFAAPTLAGAAGLVQRIAAIARVPRRRDH